jgi:hypothetical protein
MTVGSRRAHLNKGETDKLTHLRFDELQGRLAPLLPLWDGERWSLWTPTKEGTLLKIGMSNAVHCDYLAAAPEAETDLYIPFIDFMVKRAYWPDVVHWVDGLRDDVHNLSTSLAKIDFFFDHSRGGDVDGLALFVSTELEYVFTVCRSFFDLLQETIARLWKTVRFFDEEAEAARRPLKESFADMALEANQPRTKERLKERFGLPEPLANFYVEATPFFLKLRSHRDQVVHGGKSPAFVYCTHRGFALEPDLEPFASLGVWEKTELFNSRLVSLRPALAHLVVRTLQTCDAFAEAVSKVIKFPPDVAPGLRLFLRGHHNAALIRARSALDRGEHWWAP